jgi:hypothetical protein
MSYLYPSPAYPKSDLWHECALDLAVTIRDGGQAADRPNERASDGIQGNEMLAFDDIFS